MLFVANRSGLDLELELGQTVTAASHDEDSWENEGERTAKRGTPHYGEASREGQGDSTAKRGASPSQSSTNQSNSKKVVMLLDLTELEAANRGLPEKHPNIQELDDDFEIASPEHASRGSGELEKGTTTDSVSYTHLTLPTILRV